MKLWNQFFVSSLAGLFKRITDPLQRFFAPAEDRIFGSILRGSVTILTARVGNALLLIVINLLIARRFGAEMVGLIAAVNSALIVASIFSLAGTQISVLRLIPEQVAIGSTAAGIGLFDRLRKLVACMSLPVSALLIIAGTLLSTRFPNLPFKAWLCGIPFLLLFHSLARLNSETLRALKQIRIYAFAHLMPAASFLLCLIAMAWLLPTKASPLLAFFVSLAATFLISEGLVRQRIKRMGGRPAIKATMSIRAILAISWPMGITTGMQLLLANADQFMLALFRSGREAGIYSIANKLALLLSFIILSVNAVSAVHFAELNCSDRQHELIAAARKSSRLIFWASLPIFLSLLLAGRFILNWFGRDFSAGYSTLVLLACGQFINAAAGSVAIFLNMTGGHKPFQKIMILAALANLGLNVWLIPLYGMVGAAVVDLLCLVFWNAAAAMLIYHRHGAFISYVPAWLRKWRPS